MSQTPGARAEEAGEGGRGPRGEGAAIGSSRSGPQPQAASAKATWEIFSLFRAGGPCQSSLACPSRVKAAVDHMSVNGCGHILIKLYFMAEEM